MRVGSVHDGPYGLCPYVDVVINGPFGDTVTQVALVDSGPNGFVSLPAGVVDELRLIPDGSDVVELANAESESVLLFAGAVTLGRWRLSVPIHQIGDEPTVGTALLRSFNLSIDFVPDGEIRLSPIA